MTPEAELTLKRLSMPSMTQRSCANCKYDGTEDGVRCVPGDTRFKLCDQQGRDDYGPDSQWTWIHDS